MADKIIDKAVRKIPDFPKKGILFYDITGILINPNAFKYCIDKMVELSKESHIDGVVGIDSRGFLFAAPLADRLGLPLVLVRKKGKLPGDTYSATYQLEYGEATIEVQKADIEKGKKYLVVDDLIATGGTLTATKEIIEMGGGTVAEFLGVIGLPKLNYEKALKPTKVTTLINYEE